MLPWLYLGSQDVAADSVLMAQYNITRVLNVGTGIRIDREAGGVLERGAEGRLIQSCDDCYRRVEMLDTPEYDLRAGLAECEEQLVQWREEGCSVLVHCNAGVSRAPTVIIAFLITQMVSQSQTSNQFYFSYLVTICRGSLARRLWIK